MRKNSVKNNAAAIIFHTSILNVNLNIHHSAPQEECYEWLQLFRARFSTSVIS